MQRATLFIGHVAKDPNWLVEVRSRTEILRAVMNEFMQQKPKIFAQIITSFINYQTTFDACAQNSKAITSTKQWIECLQLLQKTLKQNITLTNEAQQVFTKSYNQAKMQRSYSHPAFKMAGMNLRAKNKQWYALQQR